MSFKKYAPRLKRWHSRIGLTLALPLVMLAITGILINHGKALQLGERVLPQRLASLSYGLTPTTLDSLTIENTYVEAHNDQLHVMPKALSTSHLKHSDTEQHTITKSCTEGLKGAANIQGEVWIACKQQVHLFLPSEEGLLYIEQLSKSTGLPTPITNFGRCEQDICVTTSGEQYRYNSKNNNWSHVPLPLAPLISPSILQRTQTAVPLELNWSRWILDLHSGRLFGFLGVWLIDITGIAVLVLVLTGFLRWAMTKS